MIHLRTLTDANGDAVEYLWYCSATCYYDSFVRGIGTVVAPMAGSAGVEEGGAYPCGAEHDNADYCATCKAPVGNPLTEEGDAAVTEYVAAVMAPNPPSHYANAESMARAQSLRSEYGYLWADE